MQTETTGTGSKNAMGNFYVDVVDAKIMRTAIRELKIELPEVDADSTDEQLALALALFFKKTTGKDDQVRCDECNAISSDVPTMTFKINGNAACPFCGDTGDNEVATASKDEADSAPDVSVDDEDESDEEDEEDDAEEEDEDESDEDAKEEAKAAPSPENNPPANAAKEKTMTTEATTMNGSGKPKAASKKTAAAAKPKAEKPAKGAEMVKVSSGNVIVKAPELDAAVAEVKRLQREMIDGTKSNARAYWHFGKKLLEIVDAQLFKLRKTGDGKPVHKSFGQFCLMEFGMTEGHAYAAIDVAKEYKTPDDVVALGQTKAVHLLRAVPEDRPAIAEKIKAGASLREVREMVSESRAQKGSPKKDSPHARMGQKSAGKKKEKKEKSAAVRSEKITVASMEGVRKLKAYKKPESLRGVTLSDQPRAKRLADVPTAINEMGNGVYQIIALLTDDSGNLFFKVDTRREAT